MKLLVLAIFVISAICSNVALEVIDKLKADMVNAATDCAKEHEVSEDEFNMFINKISAPKSPSGQCMLLCVAQRLGPYDADAKYSEEGAKKFFEPLKAADEDLYDLIMSITEKCEKEVGTGADHCKTAADFYQCTITAEKELMG